MTDPAHEEPTKRSEAPRPPSARAVLIPGFLLLGWTLFLAWVAWAG